MRCEYLGKTQVGKRHAENEDCIVCREFEEAGGYLIGVVDGASSAAFGGSLARWLAGRWLNDGIPISGAADVGDAFEDYLYLLDREFRAEFDDLDEMLESYASFCVALFYGERVSIYWAGDSPAYLTTWRTGCETVPLTQPHAIGHKLTRHFGGRATFAPQCETRALDVGDVVTIVSDGAVHSAEAFVALFEEVGFGETAVQRVIDEALMDEHADDVSVVMCRRAG